MDINDWRGIGTILCMAGFLGVVYWAYSPSRKAYFEEAGQLPFLDETSGEQEDGASKHE